ncbi:MAG TPA: hypothetical protein VN611_03510 [Patescibacteria group bacterium]|nr:hypothetical protein [Patescibacteria group bacterium]
MKIARRTAALLFFVMTLAVASPAAWAGCDSTSPGIILDQPGAGDWTWTFSLINLTGSNVQIGSEAAEGSDHNLGSEFPYGHVYPPGNSTGTPKTNTTALVPGTLNLTTWKSNSHKDMFPDYCSSTVPVSIVSDTAYNFSVKFSMSGQKSAQATLQPPYSSSTWKYSTNVPYGDNGYYAYPGNGWYSGDGILFAISDKYLLSLFKNTDYNLNANDLILVITYRNPKNDYHGNNVRWYF